jgi:hypothetical protein
VKVTVVKSFVAVGLTVGDGVALATRAAPPVAIGVTVGIDVGATVGTAGWVTLRGDREEGVVGTVTDAHPVASIPIRRMMSQAIWASVSRVTSLLKPLA